MHFSDKIEKRMQEINSRLVIGIDPHPEKVLDNSSVFATTLNSDDPEYLLSAFCDIALEVAARTACAVKPQAAFFECAGIPGWRSLRRCIKMAREMDLPVILDIKRGDIGSTASAYARAYLDPSSEFFSDAVTVNPYLGPDSLEPFVAAAKKSGSGIFVLVKTSNPGSGAFQDAVLADGEPLFARVARVVAAFASSSIGNCGYSGVGAVVGATYPEHLSILRSLLPQSIILLPGYGAQGGKAENLKAAFHPGGRGALVSSSRAIIFSYENSEPGQLSESRIFDAMLEAAQKAKKEIQAIIGTGASPTSST